MQPLILPDEIFSTQIDHNIKNIMDSDGLDSLCLGSEPNLINQLSVNQQIRFSCGIKKLNDDNILQQRIFLLTNEAIYNIIHKKGFIKSIVSRLINIQNKYTIKRKMLYKQIYGVSLAKNINSKDKQTNHTQFILSIIDESDYKYCVETYEKKVFILKHLAEVYREQMNRKLPFYFVEDAALNDYFTTKSDVKKKISRKPKENADMLTFEDFEQYQMPDVEHNLEYVKAHNSNKISMKDFKAVFQVEKLQNNNKYYVLTVIIINEKNNQKQLTEKCKKVLQSIKSIMIICQQSKYFILPEFIFSTKDKLTLISPFMIGGNLSKKLQTSVKISEELAYFYIAQLIIMLQQFQRMGIFYGNFCLDNLYINENGYLRIIGVDKCLIKCKQQKMYHILGYLPYIAPEMILCKGYSIEVNLWKLGISAYKLLFGCFPFEGNNTKKVYSEIINKKLKPDTPSFLLRLLQKQVNNRIKLEQLKKQDVFSKISWQKLKNQTVQAPYQPDISSWKGNLPSIVKLSI